MEKDIITAPIKQARKQSHQLDANTMKLRVATYNILNLSDRYDERERLMKRNLYELNADIVGLQEVAFGPEQLDELLQPRGNGIRHSVEAHGRGEGYEVYEAPFQIPDFHADTLLDPRARCDGNAFLVDPRLKSGASCDKHHHHHKVVKHEVLHLSAYLNCQRLELALSDGSRVHIVNLHLHDLVEEEQVRLHQAQNVVYWLSKRTKPEDLIIMMGDFNAIPENETVSWLLGEGGFKSAYRTYHGDEPDRTYNTGLISPYMDLDPPCTVDYIFYKGRSTGVKLAYAKRMGEGHEPGDPTLFGSDHYPLIADFEILLQHPQRPHPKDTATHAAVAMIA